MAAEIASENVEETIKDLDLHKDDVKPQDQPLQVAVDVDLKHKKASFEVTEHF